MCTYYESLGVSTTASPPQIRRAYLGLAFLYHPDRNRDNEHESDIKFEEIRRAYSVLSNNDKRRKYDRSLKSKQPFESNLRINSTIIVLKWSNLQKKSPKHEAQLHPQKQKVSPNLKCGRNCTKFALHKSQSFPSLTSDRIANLDIFRSMLNEYKCEDMCPDKQKRTNPKKEDNCENMATHELNHEQTNDSNKTKENGKDQTQGTNDDDFPKIVDVSPLASFENLMLDESSINTTQYYEGNYISDEINKAKDDVVPADKKKLISESSGDVNEDNINAVIKNIRRKENIGLIFDNLQKNFTDDNLTINKKEKGVAHKKPLLNRNEVSVSVDNLAAKDTTTKKPFRSFQSNTKDTITNTKNPKYNNKEISLQSKNLRKEENEKDVNVSVKYLRLKKKQSSVSVSNLPMTGRSDPNVIKPTIDKKVSITNLKNKENIAQSNTIRPYKNESRTSLGNVRANAKDVNTRLLKGSKLNNTTETTVSPEKSLLLNRKESKMSIENIPMNDKDNISVKFLRLRKKNATSSTSSLQSPGKSDNVSVQNVIINSNNTPTRQLCNKDSRLSFGNIPSNQKDINTSVRHNRVNSKDSRTSMNNLPQLECENVSIKYLRLKRKTSSMSSTDFQIHSKPDTVLNSNSETTDKGSNYLTRNQRSTSSLNQSNEKDVKNIRPIRTESRRASMQNLIVPDKDNVSVKYLRLKRKTAMSTDNITITDKIDKKNPIKTNKTTDKKPSQLNISRSNSKDINAIPTNLSRTDSSVTFNIDRPNSGTNQPECDEELRKIEKLRTQLKDVKASMKKPKTCENINLKKPQACENISLKKPQACEDILPEDNSSEKYPDLNVENEVCMENLRTYEKSTKESGMSKTLYHSKLSQPDNLRTKGKDGKASINILQACDKDIVSEDKSSDRYFDIGVEKDICIENLRTYGKSSNGRVKNIRPKRKNSGVSLANLWTSNVTSSSSKETIIVSGKDDDNEKVPDIINIGAYLANLRLNQFNSAQESRSQRVSTTQPDAGRDAPGSVRDGKFKWDFGSDEEKANSNLI